MVIRGNAAWLTGTMLCTMIADRCLKLLAILFPSILTCLSSILKEHQ